LQTHSGVVKFRNVLIKPFRQRLEPGKPTLVLDPGMHTAQIQGVFFREKGKQLVTVGADHTVRLWEVQDKGLRQVEVIHPPGQGPLQNAELSKDGKLLAFSTQTVEKGKYRPVVYVLPLPERRVIRAFPSVLGRDARLAFTFDGKRLAATAWNQPIYIWDLATDDPPLQISTGWNYRYGRLAFSPDGKRIVWATGDQFPGGARLFNVETKAKIAEMSGIRAAWSPDGKTIATTDNGAIRLHDADGKLLHTFEKTVWTHLAFSPDSKWLLVDGWQLFDLLKKEQRLLPTKPPYTGTHPSYG